MNKFKIGDKVKITNLGGVYSSYEDWAKQYGLLNWQYYKSPKKFERGYVVAIGKHLSDSCIICAVETHTGVYMFKEDCLELLDNKKLKREEILAFARAMTTDYFGLNPTMISLINLVECKQRGYYLQIRLPTSNTDWTLGAFDVVKKIVENYPKVYPVHYDSPAFNNDRYLYLSLTGVE